MASLRPLSPTRDIVAQTTRDADAADLAAPLAPIAELYIAMLVTSLAGRLNRGASSYYLRHFEIGMTEFRIVLAVGLAKGLNVGEVAAAADVDKAAASRSLRLLQERGIVEMEQTNTRGRAAIVHLTTEGHKFEREITKAAKRRDKRLLEALTVEERVIAVQLLRKLIDSVPNMNND
jgi:DNA-binding MarR family transcriptional regulator